MAKQLTYQEWLKLNPEYIGKKVPCLDCDGLGWYLLGWDEKECQKCDGHGTVDEGLLVYESIKQRESQKLGAWGLSNDHH